MIVTLALRTLLNHPIRTAVLAGGFGLGVAVMAALLGIGQVILEQARSPALVGGGDIVVTGAAGRITTAKFVVGSVLGQPPLVSQVTAVAPSQRGSLVLFRGDRTVPIRVRGGVPSRERALGDAETSGEPAWTDTPADKAWSAPEPGDVLRAMDRFHPIPDVPARQASWAEWLYFNGQSGDTRFYLAFLVGPPTAGGGRPAGVRLQLERDGRLSSYSGGTSLDDNAVGRAPDLTIGGNSVRLAGETYHITLDLEDEETRRSGGTSTRGPQRVTGVVRLTGAAGRSLAPIWIRGAGGWVSGYTVPVMAGQLDGHLEVGSQTIDLGGGTGYHDHNWGYWSGVTWRWGQVQQGQRSFVYGRIIPPPDAADASRIPGFLAAIGPEGLIGYTTDVGIEESTSGTGPSRITVTGRGASIDLRMTIDVVSRIATAMRPGLFGGGLDFLQLRAQYQVDGTLAGEPVSFTAPGAAETFRGRPTSAAPADARR